MQGLSLGVVLGLALACGLLAWWSRGGLPPLTQAELEAAARRWQQSGVRDYELELVQSGSQTGHIRLTVREGAVTAMTRDGRAPARRQAWDYWTVPNLLEIMRLDLQNCARRQAQGQPRLVLRAEFDERLGYPRKYQCVELGGGRVTEWEIVRFETHDDRL